MVNKKRLITVVTLGLIAVSVLPAYADSNNPFSPKTPAPQSSVDIGNLNQTQQSGVDLKAVDLSEMQKQEQLKQAEKKGDSYIPPSIFKGTPLEKKQKAPIIQHEPQADESAIEAEQEKIRARQVSQLESAFKSLKQNLDKQGAGSQRAIAFDQGSTSSGSSEHQYKPENTYHTKKINVIAQSGDIWYATLSTSVDSYINTPVVAEIDQGPFSGAKVVGKFSVAGDGEHTILTFNQMSFGNKTYQVSAVAVSPGTKLPALTGNVDHHFFRRYVLPAAVNFLAGAANIATQSDSVQTTNGTVVVNNNPFTNRKLYWSMLGNAAAHVGSQVEPTGVWQNPEIKIPQGTGMGILLVKSIVESQ